MYPFDKSTPFIQASRYLAIVIIIMTAAGCAAPKINLFPDGTEPLKEFVLQGTYKEKIAVISISGFISNKPKEGVFKTAPGVVQETVAQIRLAEKDRDVKAVLLKIDSPGGTTTASDILYREIADFKERTGKKVIAVMMDVAASGGYYVALAADHIMAHPTTITGSVGVIFIQPKVFDLMQKIGVDVQVSKSGKNKDMGSPFRQATEKEDEILQDLIDALGKRFIDLVAEHRKPGAANLERIRSARVFLSPDALEVGLLDSIGYLQDAVGVARKLAELPDDSKVVIYRRTEHPDDNIYNTATSRKPGPRVPLIDLGMLSHLTNLRTGFYYLWPAAVNNR